ncbi:MAG TPA: zf-HC2 domain-containing protein [Ktedonobacterales bacterium]
MGYLEHDWDRQREQLSALLDNELAEQDRAELEAHLQTCANCRAELASLRRGRALVRALPQPALPRSFALLPEASRAQAMPQQAASTPRLASGSERRPARVTPARITNRRRPVRALQWFSTIAAVLGIALLLSSVFSSPSFRNASTAANTSQAPESAGQLGNSSTPSPRTPNTQPSVGTPVLAQETPTATPERDAKQPNSDKATDASSHPSSGPLISLTSVGVILLLLSVCGFVVAWVIRRRL